MNMNSSHLMLMAIEDERLRTAGPSLRQAPAPAREHSPSRLRRVFRRRAARQFTRPTVTGAAVQAGL
jgi:hypothetical protein